MRFLFIILFLPSLIFANEPRHKAKGGDHIIELVPGLVLEGSHKAFELGIDYEFFPEESHFYSIGFSFENEFLSNDEHYIGPHIAFYFLGHYKLFYTSGVNFYEASAEWKNMLGFGYEFILKNHLVLVPAIILDHTPRATKTILSFGIGYEF